MKYILFIDESGHHGLKTINSEFPIFLLCGCLIEENYYKNSVCKEFENLKIKYFERPDIVFHSNDIRKWQKDFKILGDTKLRARFYKDLNNLIRSLDFNIIASAVLKEELIKEYGPQAGNPYDLSLAFILENTVLFCEKSKIEKIKIVCEARGKKEDSQLHAQARTIFDNGSSLVVSEKYQKIFEDFSFLKKRENIVGTQICDLMAYPLATKILYPDRENLAFKIVEKKLYRQFPDGDYLDYGLKIFP